MENERPVIVVGDVLVGEFLLPASFRRREC